MPGKYYDPDHFNPGDVSFDKPYKRWKGAFLDDLHTFQDIATMSNVIDKKLLRLSTQDSNPGDTSKSVHGNVVYVDMSV